MSSYRSEGLGLTMAEAMLMAKPVVATRYSGNLDFMDESNSLLVDIKMVKVGPNCPPYQADAYWAEPSESHAAEQMRKLYDNQEWAKTIGKKAQRDMLDKHSIDVSGREISKVICEIQDTINHNKTNSLNSLKLN